MVLFDAHGRPVGSAHAILASARDPVVLDLGSFNSLGSAKSWSLTILSKDGPHSVAPAASVAANRRPKRSRCVLARFRSYRSTPCRTGARRAIRPRSPTSPRRGSAPSSSPTTAREPLARYFGARES